jgi:hypothetical protein
MHKIQGGQKVRILTLQVAVPANADPSQVADEFTEMLTCATAEEDSNVLDWQYLDGPENDTIIIASEDPEEGEIFTNEELSRPAPWPKSFAVMAFGDMPTLIKLQRLVILISSNQAITLSRILMETLEQREKNGDLPGRVALTLNGAFAENDFREALTAGTVVSAI